MSTNVNCPICSESFSNLEIENHVNKCLCLNSQQSGTFEPEPSLVAPLTEQLRPKSFKEFFGHNPLIGRNTYLRQMLDDNQIPNVIFWGPPGCGKTSLMNIIMEICERNNESYVHVLISALNMNMFQIYTKKDQLKCQQQLILFVDQIHWLDKKQQNQLLHLIRNDNVVLVGATTENPSFSLSETFLNICPVIAMKKLRICDVVEILKNAARMLNVNIMDAQNTLTNMFCDRNKPSIKQSTLQWLAENCDGDARIALNNFELILHGNSESKVMQNQIKKGHILYDRNSEEHHNIISAMHESIKAYNDNAALYWTTRMLLGGEDLQFIARRLVRAASEDTGNKDIKTLQLTVKCNACLQGVGKI